MKNILILFLVLFSTAAFAQFEQKDTLTGDEKIRLFAEPGGNVSVTTGQIADLASNDDLASNGELVHDNSTFPSIRIVQAARGISYTGTVHPNNEVQGLNSLDYIISNQPYGTGGEFGGVLVSSFGANETLTVTAPFSVGAGDSTMKGGGPDGKGSRLQRKQQVAERFDPNYPDSLGQVSYRIEQETGFECLNNGIGGQTTYQILNRFRRDVLGETYKVPNDFNSSFHGVNKTHDGLPVFAVCMMGINDLKATVDITAVETINNFKAFARLCVDNGINVVFTNLPGNEILPFDRLVRLDSINNFLNNGGLDQYGAKVVDFNTLWQDPDRRDNIHRNTNLIADAVHPNAVGYDSLARVIVRETHLPKLDSITFKCEFDPSVTNYSRPVNIVIDGKPFTLTGDISVMKNFSSRLSYDTIGIQILSVLDPSKTYTGFSHITYHLSNDIDSTVVTRRSQIQNAGIDIVGESNRNDFLVQGNNGSSKNLVKSNMKYDTIQGVTIIDNHLLDPSKENSTLKIIVDLPQTGNTTPTTHNVIDVFVNSRTGNTLHRAYKYYAKLLSAQTQIELFNVGLRHVGGGKNHNMLIINDTIDSPMNSHQDNHGLTYNLVLDHDNTNFGNVELNGQTVNMYLNGNYNQADIVTKKSYARGYRVITDRTGAGTPNVGTIVSAYYSNCISCLPSDFFVYQEDNLARSQFRGKVAFGGAKERTPLFDVDIEGNLGLSIRTATPVKLFGFDANNEGGDVEIGDGLDLTNGTLSAITAMDDIVAERSHATAANALSAGLTSGNVFYNTTSQLFEVLP